MASFLNAAKKLHRNLPTGTAPGTFKGFLVDKGERYGAAAVFGFAKGYYAEKFLLAGHGIDLWAGAALTLGSALATGLGHHGIATHLERFGDAGMMSAIGALAASYGMKKGGHSVAFVSANKPAALPGRNAVVGAIPPAQGGATLDASQIMNYARAR